MKRESRVREVWGSDPPPPPPPPPTVQSVLPKTDFLFLLNKLLIKLNWAPSKLYLVFLVFYYLSIFLFEKMDKSHCPLQLVNYLISNCTKYDLYVLLHDSDMSLNYCNVILIAMANCYGIFCLGLKLKVRSTLKVYAAATFKITPASCSLRCMKRGCSH